MSRIGNQVITAPNGVSVNVEGKNVAVKGAKGELSLALPDGIKARVEGSSVFVERQSEEQNVKSLHGLFRALIANMVEGVSRGYSKDLEIEGVGFKASVQGKKASFLLGFSSPVELDIPQGINLTVNDNVNITVAGADKQSVGDFAARIKALFPAEPYKGKGIRFKGEHVRRKVGKTVA
jgi:large subunit ribosomal protein L6